MRFLTSPGDATRAEVEALAVPIAEGEARGPLADRLDASLDGGLTTLLADLDFTGKPKSVRLVSTLGRLPTRRLALVGVGRQPLDLDGLRLLAGQAARAARDSAAASLAIALPEALDASTAAQAAAEGVLLATYRDRRYKSNGSESRSSLSQIHLYVADGAEEAARAGLARGQEIAAGVCLARDLVNQPGADLWPERLATIAATLASDAGLACDVYDEQALADLGAGALLGVGHGSDRPPRLIHLRYRPDGEAAEPAVTLVGKGITFDSGGYSIKTAAGMETMKGDMAGAAAVLGAMQAIARLRPALAVDAVIASAENMVSGRAMRPGDVLTAMSGTTIEVNNTDAEGRLVLADALAFAIRHGARELIDLATLTGACVVALGNVASGVMGNDQAMIDRLLAAGAAAGERLWQLPLYAEYRDTLRSEVADLRNSGGRNAGAQIGASFLREFVGETPWVHLDIAGPSFIDKATPLCPKGGSGVGVATLVAYVEDAARRATPD